jgi:dienelactone hydrolase
MVRITATAAQAGKAYSVRKDGRELGRGVLQLKHGRAVADLVLPRRPGRDVNKGLKVAMDGFPAVKVDAPDAPERGADPSLTIRVAPSETGRVSVRTGLTVYDALFPVPGVSARITIRDATGRVTARTDCPLGMEGTTVSLPDGAYTVQATVDDLNGWKCEGREFCLIDPDLRYAAAGLADRGVAMSAEPGFEAYAGWLDYLATEIRQVLAAPATDSTTQTLSRRAVELAGWMGRIRRDPQALAKLRGLQEWAYRSGIDGTGQPFSIVIPAGYTPRKAYPLDVYLHGASGSHAANGGTAMPGFRLHVLARSSYSAYRALGEVDVLEAVAYVRAHWNIDPDRIHLTGDSMGGGGTFALAARFPDMFASARAFCGYGSGIDAANMLNLPVCSTHSQDDWMVPIVQSRGVTRALREAGGAVIQNETNGFGHIVQEWKEGLQFAHAWAAKQVRPKSMRRVHYAATDELARRAYWVEVAEWGPDARPATIDARLEPDNTLYLSLDNVNIARFDLSTAPAEQNTTLALVVNGLPTGAVPSPLPRELFVSRRAQGWDAGSSAPSAPTVRRHFPGGAMALFHGEPIMVVWGTGGGEDAAHRIFKAAQSARKSVNPQWPKVAPFTPPAPIFNEARNAYYGQLPGKPDTEVTQADMDTHNLLLIGTAKQNSVVAKLADRLPVRVEGSAVKSGDGMSWDFKGRALGLLYHNPAAPGRLIYWVGSDTPSFYARNAHLLDRQGWPYTSPDFLLAAADGSCEVAARCFDSAWNWAPGYSDSPLVPADNCSSSASAAMVGEAIRREAGADYAVFDGRGDTGLPGLVPGETRLADVVENGGLERLCLVELTGKDLLARADLLEKAARERAAKEAMARMAMMLKEGDDSTAKDSVARTLMPPVPQFHPAPNPAVVDPKAKYRIVMPEWTARGYAVSTQTSPPDFHLTGATVRGALQRQLRGLD